MNFVTQALESLVSYHRMIKAKRMEVCDAVMNIVSFSMQKAPKFLLPPPQTMGVELNETSIVFAKLPYPVCVFEYTDERHITRKKRIAIVSDAASKNLITNMVKHYLDIGNYDVLDRERLNHGMYLLTVFYDEGEKNWCPSIGVVHIDPAGLNRNAHGEPSLIIGSIPVFTEIYKLLLSQKNITDAKGLDMIAEDVKDDIQIVLRALVMMNAKNLKTITVIEPSAALNKKRNRNGKPPFFEYKTLDVFLSNPDDVRQVRKQVNYAGIKAAFQSAGASRLSAVRGHFKVRKTGVYWWNSFTRGAKKNGEIVKDYNLKRE